MCNLYSLTKGQQSIRELTRTLRDRSGNLPPMPGVYPDTHAPMVRNSPEGRELVMGRWGMPSPAMLLRGKATDPGVTNVRNTASAHWRPWLGVAHRCVVPFTSFAEPTVTPDGRRSRAWFALAKETPLACFAGIWTRWASVRRLKEGETTNDLFAFLTCPPNAEVAALHPKAMPVVLTTNAEIDTWLDASWPEAQALQRPLPDGALCLLPPAEPQPAPAQPRLL